MGGKTMPKFNIQFRLTEITDREVTVEAETIEEAIGLVEDYQFDLDDSRQFDCHMFELEILN